MKLRDKQVVFAWAVSKLIQKSFDIGYEPVLGETYRHPKTAEYMAASGKGIKNSLHTKCLAIDLPLFKEGVYLTSTESYRPLGEWWEKFGKENDLVLCWGGRFDDGNHFSLEHEGIQ